MTKTTDAERGLGFEELIEKAQSELLAELEDWDGETLAAELFADLDLDLLEAVADMRVRQTGDPSPRPPKTED